MAASSLSSLSSILTHPQGCSLCFKATTRRCFALTFLSSKLNHSSSSSSTRLTRCHNANQIKRKNGFRLDLSRSFSVSSQSPSSSKFNGPNLHQFVPVIKSLVIAMSGFCGETEEEHEETISLVRVVGYDMAYMFAYSMREKTHAHRNYVDDVPEEVKQRRLVELIDAFRETTGPCYDSQVGSIQLVLVEGPNKRAPETELIGKTDKGHRVSFVRKALIDRDCVLGNDVKRNPEIGDFVEVLIEKSTRASLFGEAIAISKMSLFHNVVVDDVVVVASCAS